MIHPSFPTTAQIRASIIARDCMEREIHNPCISHEVQIMSGAIGHRLVIVKFKYEEGQTKMFNGRDWK